MVWQQYISSIVGQNISDLYITSLHFNEDPSPQKLLPKNQE